MSFGLTLPPVEIEVFDGDMAVYREFKIKVQSILSMGHYSEEMKVIFLKNHLADDPLDSVFSILPDDPGAYDEIWSILDEDFGDAELGFDYHLNLLLSIGSWSPCTTDDDLKKLYRHINTSYAALKHYGPEAVRQAEAAKIYILPLLSGHAPHKVTKLHENNSTNYNIPEVLKILKSTLSHQKFIESSRSLKRESRKNQQNRKEIHVNHI